MEAAIKRVAIFGGTFDPIHLGHLNLAINLQEEANLDEIWFCPAHLSPHKLDTKPTAAKHRLAMLEIAIQGHESFRILDWELNRPSPSYTIDTIESLLKDEKLKNHHYSLILSDDAFEHFHRWHRVEEIIKKVTLLIGSRDGLLAEISPNTPLAVLEALKAGVKKTLLMEVSGTLARKRLKSGLYCEHLIPQKVLDYIYRHHLYST